MAVRPTFGALQFSELEGLLYGLFLADLAQLRRGVAPIYPALRPDRLGRRRLRYIRRDPSEHWRTISEIWRYGGGDCEDLAAAEAARIVFQGLDPRARPVLYRVRPGLIHAVVQLGDGMRIDPSRTGGMGEP